MSQTGAPEYVPECRLTNPRTVVTQSFGHVAGDVPVTFRNDNMSKPVPDPPCTAHSRFGTCSGHHPPLFSVCEGISLEDALVHLAMSLTSAYETNYQVCESADRPLQGLRQQ